jgi:hypothetical protein
VDAGCIPADFKLETGTVTDSIAATETCVPALKTSTGGSQVSLLVR